MGILSWLLNRGGRDQPTTALHDHMGSPLSVVAPPKAQSPIETVDLEAARAGSHAASQIAKANDDMVSLLWVLAERGGGALRIGADDIKRARGGVIRFSVDKETGDTVIIRTSW